MYYFNNPYTEVPFFNLNQINELKGPNPLESNRLLGGFWEKNQLAFCFANPAADSSILAYQTANNLANGIGFDFLDNQSNPHKVLVIDFKNDITTIKTKYTTFTLSDPLNNENLHITSFNDQNDAFLQKHLNKIGLSELVEKYKVQSLILIGIDRYLHAFNKTKPTIQSFIKILNMVRIHHKISILCFADLPEVPIKDFSLKSIPKTPLTSCIIKMDNVFLLKTLNHDNKLLGLKVLKTQNEQYLFQDLAFCVAQNIKSFNHSSFEVLREENLDPDTLTHQTPQSTLEMLIIDQYTKNPKISYGDLSQKVGCSKTHVFNILKKHLKDKKLDSQIVH